ncbi:hypothetical protein ACLS0R_18595 [Comamonas jiangduensis]|uniref:hypothetical protein n=1 Tax=Comamonas jiangduensis TaxID=1194168 RepID=UPI003BF804BD
MANLGSLWAGHVYGTNTGNFFLEFEKIGPTLVGKLRFMDSHFGLSLYQVEGQFDGRLALSGTCLQGMPEVETGDLVIEADLTSEGQLRGTWKSSVGTGGTFLAYPHEASLSDQREAQSTAPPEQLYTANITLGAIRLSIDAVDELAEFVRREFVVGRPILTYFVRGNEVTKYYQDFKADADVPYELRYLKLTIQELEAHGINRVVVVELSAHGENVVRVQGINESWVVGKAEATARMLRGYEKTLVTTYKKFGLSLNQVIFLAMLVTMPSILSLRDRIVFAAVLVALLNALYWFHQRFIPNALISVHADQPSLLRKISPTIVSWIGAASASLAAALVYKWLTETS